MRQEGGKAMDELWQYEREALAAGHTAVCGCDEAGAGPLAGPVYAAAVILAPGTELPGLNDSKKLTEKKREALFPLIQEKALSGFRPHRRQPGPGTQRRHHHGTQDDCKGRQLVSVYRGGLHPGQGEPGPLDGPGGGGVPSVPV